MIFYFSATGNSRHTAKKIAKALGENAVSITDCLKKDFRNFIVDKNEKIGFVFPVYNFGLPITVTDFIEKLNIKANNNYVFTVATFGGFSGSASKMIKERLFEKGIVVNAQFSVRMPDTWTPAYDVSDKTKIAKINAKADRRIDAIIKKIQKHKSGNYDSRRIPFGDKFYGGYEAMRRTNSLSVESRCTGCGLCAKECPVDAIQMQGGKPVWVKEKCAMCLGCLHRCPEFAIQRGSKTKEHGQYLHD
ncbi:MAG: EFR1 family ferrodoxin [Clostridia bacterium]|nr:EFR1 family ferrodoxin [Clostridia bacterium]